MLLGWSLNGYAQSLGFASGGRLITNWWGQRKRGRTFGLYLLAAGVSSVITYGLSIWVLNSLGWGYVFRIPVLFLLLAGVVFATVARNSPEQEGFAGSTDDVNLDPAAEPVRLIDRYRVLFTN
jgi:OPA family glycerol-3-phosphate transporter-like MFS transporter